MYNINPVPPTLEQSQMIQDAVALHQAGQLDLAENLYNELLIDLPYNTVLLTNLGTIALQRGRLEDAIIIIGKSLQINPNQPNALNNGGTALKDLNRLDAALDSFDRAITLKPEYAEAFSNRGNTLDLLNRLDEALLSFDRAITLKPDYADAYSNRGVLLNRLNRFEEALLSFDRAITLKPDYADAYSNRGNALKDLNRFDDALESYDRAIVLKPDCVEAYNNRAIVLQDVKRLDESLQSYDYAIALKPNYIDAYWNKSLLKILTGEYLEGWQLYEWRWKKEPLNNSLRVYEQPIWLGNESLINKTVLIYPEQGLKDYIQCIRYSALLEQLGATVILEVPLPLMKLASSLKGQFMLVESGSSLPDFDFHCPVMSLPLAFKTTVETIPTQMPYLFADKDKKKAWNKKLGKKILPRIGLVWSSSMEHKNDHNRSLLLKQLEALLELPVEFHSLQKEVREIDVNTLIDFHHIHQHQNDLLDFSDTAALVDAMDVVISVDTSVAHLTGAMGKKVCILLPYAPNYRWMLDRADSPWYPSATLFRQPAIGDWESVIAEVKQFLTESVL